jgi:hypothetical protein
MTDLTCALQTSGMEHRDRADVLVQVGTHGYCFISADTTKDHTADLDFTDHEWLMVVAEYLQQLPRQEAAAFLIKLRTFWSGDEPT